jgi:response regulator RpfG family c-di-GMP phosphodiesterase
MRKDGKGTAVRVTIVDDEPLARDVLLRAAGLWRYECQTANSAEEALTLLEQRPTPIVVTDLRMPGQGGVWLVRELRRRWPEVAIIVVTAGQDADAAFQCLNAGANHYFLKPINLDEFRHALDATWRSYQLERAHAHHRRQLENAVARQTRRVRHTFLRAIDSLVRTMEERDPYTAGHSRRVRQYALRLAHALGLEPVQCRRLSLAAKLHDIGKVGIAEAILNKKGALSPEEQLIVRGHPVIGERILTPILHNRATLAAIRGHHERLDGSGYPDGLKGEQIPLLARLIAVVDCFDALTSSRAYRDALPVTEAQDVLRAGAGRHFEPDFVHAFLERVVPEPAYADTPTASTTKAWTTSYFAS